LSRFVLDAPGGARTNRANDALQVKRMFYVPRNSEVWFRAILGAKHLVELCRLRIISIR